MNKTVHAISKLTHLLSSVLPDPQARRQARGPHLYGRTCGRCNLRYTGRKRQKMGERPSPPSPPPSERKPIRPLLAAAAAAAHAACASVEALPACQQRRNPRLSPQFVPLPRPLTRVPCCRSLAFTGQRLGFCSISGTPARGRNASFSRLSPSGTHHAPPCQAEPRLCGQSASRKSAHDSDLKSLSKRSRSLAKELVSMERPSSEGA